MIYFYFISIKSQALDNWLLNRVAFLLIGQLLLEILLIFFAISLSFQVLSIKLSWIHKLYIKFHAIILHWLLYLLVWLLHFYYIPLWFN